MILRFVPRRWFCHVDDDNYVNVRTLVRFLAQYPHTQDMYLGKPSLDRPIEATERLGDNKMVRGGVSCLMHLIFSHLLLSTTLFSISALAETGQLLVCDWGSWVLCEPGFGAEDEPMGQVRQDLKPAQTVTFDVFLFGIKSLQYRVLSCLWIFQWRSLHEHGGEDPLARRLHHRLHH